MERMKNTYEIELVNLTGLGVHMRMILTSISKEQNMRMWIRFIWLGIGIRAAVSTGIK